jgi:hypothetical protein
VSSISTVASVIIIDESLKLEMAGQFSVIYIKAIPVRGREGS